MTVVFDRDLSFSIEIELLLNFSPKFQKAESFRRVLKTVSVFRPLNHELN